MSLDGLRAWIGEVERKLGMRTRVFLVLAAIAIGGAAAGIYLALEAADESISKDEVQALQERLGAGVGETAVGTEAAAVAALKAEVEALRTELSELEEQGSPSGSGKPPESKGSSEPKEGGASTAPSGKGTSGGSGHGSGSTDVPKATQKLKELIERPK